MTSRRKRLAKLRETSRSRSRSRSATPVPHSQRPSAARRALLMGLALQGPDPDPTLSPPRTQTAIAVQSTPGGSLHVGEGVPIFKTPGGHVRLRKPMTSEAIVEVVEAMDLDDEETEEVMGSHPWHVQRWIRGLEGQGEDNLAYTLSRPLTPSISAEAFVDNVSGIASVHTQNTSNAMTRPNSDSAEVRPSVSGMTATRTRNAGREVCAGSEMDSDHDDEFDRAAIDFDAFTHQGRIGRDIPNSDDEELEEPTRTMIEAVERAMDDEADRLLLGVSTSYTWEEDFDLFRGVPEIFSGPTPGPIKDYDTPYDAFTDIWSNDIIDHIVQETNRYAKQTIDSKKASGTLGSSSRLHEWVDTDADEMMVFFAVFMYMGIDSRSSQSEYWRANNCLEMPKFKQLMTYNRFILLNKFLHFVDNTDVSQCSQQSGGNSFSKKLAKLQPVISHLGKKFSSLYNLSKEISIDESLTLFKGRLSWVQTIRSKAARFVIKSYELCESKTGYLYKFEIYTGKESGNASSASAPSEDLAGKSTAVVLKLLKDLERRGHCVTMDNFYNCPALARYLKSLKFDCLGTLRKNRRNVPESIKKIRKNVAKGRIIARHCGDVSIIAWRDSKLVTMISTYHNDETYVGSKADIPYLELAEPEEGYHGLIRENETLVEVTPPIRARGPLCSFLILNNKHHGEAPFEIMVIDENEARLRVRYPLNCEKRRNYKFDIAAVGCDGSYSNTVPVHITVTDVNEFAPTFAQAAYVRAADEGRLYAELLRVSATDRDCTPRFGDVCKYEILGDGGPFAIDNEGVIRNTEPLDYEKAHTHTLSVAAYDCGMLRSEPVTVTIKVNKPCRPGWTGVAERVDYAPGSGPLALFPAARLQACSSDARCPGVTRIQAAVTLQASRAGAACDRDTYSLHAQKTICGLDPKTIDLLPSPGAGNEWAKSLKPDLGRDGEQMFQFDGETTSAVVPESLLPHALGGSFALATWMRHAPHPDGDKHRKEHVLCLADDHKMNRHHYALFVRNCRLILLLRRDFGDGDLNIFRPAEWRWKIPEVCDNEWHHYAVNVRFPSVELWVDGAPYRATDGPEVIDDWPLHPAHDINTTMVVGACWQGAEGGMRHHLRGWLAGLGARLGGSLAPPALACLARCREGLSLAPDLYLKSVSVEGDGVADVETLLRRVAYGDARADPAPGRRNVHLATTITCDNGRVIAARPAESFVMVLAPATPRVRLAGAGGAARDYAHFRAGLPVFPDLTVRVLASDKPDAPEAEVQKLDSCVVSVYPALNPDHETLSLRAGGAGGEGGAGGLPRYDMRAQVTRDGVILTGADSQQHYQEVLREIEYSNKKPAYYLNRVFKLTCSELNGRFTSNEYVQTLTVVHPHMVGGELSREQRPSGVADKLDAARPQDQGAAPHAHLAPRVYAAHAQRSPHAAELPAARTADIHADQPPTNHVALLIGAVSVGALALLAWLGVARARAPRAPRTPRGTPRPADPEMLWDDSALTITVNPMEESAAEGGAARGAGAGAADSSDDSDDDSDSDRHDSDDDDDEVMAVAGKQHKYRNISQLEWDNSTM